MSTPKIVCLIGSTRFKEAYEIANRRLTLDGVIVLSCGVFDHTELSHEQKRNLDDLHLHKIDISDSVFVLNVDGYIGESTRREINHALSHNKPVRYLEQCTQSAGELVCCLALGHTGWHKSYGYEFVDDIIISTEEI